MFLPRRQSLSPAELQAVYEKTPAATPPPGVVPNFVNPETKTVLAMSITTVFLAIMLLLALNRAYAKIVLVRKLRWDDVTIFLGLLVHLIWYGAFARSTVVAHMARHTWDISFAQLLIPDVTISFYIMTVCGTFLMLPIKVTFFLFFLQIFAQVRWVCLASWAGLAVTTMAYVGMTIYEFQAANPHPSASEYSRVGAMESKIYLPSAIIGALLDIYILMIPLVAISQLTTSFTRKMGAMAMFFSGSMACVCSIISLIFRARSQLSVGGDIFWLIIPVDICVSLEASIGITCACIPSAAYTYKHYRPAVQMVLHKLSNPSRATTTKDSSPKSDDIAKRSSVSNVLKSTDLKYAAYFELNEEVIGDRSKNKGGQNMDREQSLNNDSEASLEFITMHEPASKQCLSGKMVEDHMGRA